MNNNKVFINKEKVFVNQGEVKEYKRNKKALTREGRRSRWLWGITLGFGSLFLTTVGSFIIYKNIDKQQRSNLPLITKDIENQQEK